MGHFDCVSKGASFEPSLRPVGGRERTYQRGGGDECDDGDGQMNCMRLDSGIVDKSVHGNGVIVVVGGGVLDKSEPNKICDYIV